MASDNTNKTKRFIQKGTILWLILLGVFLAIQYLTQPEEGISIEYWYIRYFKDLNTVLFYHLICGIPIILVLSIILLYVERALDKLLQFRNRKNKDEH